MKIMLMAGALLLGGCVTPGRYHTDIDLARAGEKARCIQMTEYMRNEIDNKTDRLRLFNQVDLDGTLRPLQLKD